MTAELDPPRLLEQTDEALAALVPGLREARAAGPSAAQREALRRALGLPASLAESGAPTGPRGPRPFQNVWLIGAGLLAGTLSLILHATLQGPKPPSNPRAAAPAAMDGSGLEGARVPRTVDATPPVPEVSGPAGKPTDGLRKSPRGSRAATGAASPGAFRRAARSPRPAIEAVATEHPPEGGTSPDLPAGSLDELTLLQRARAHARSAPRRALALVAEHEAQFAGGMFVQEREVIAIEALLASNERATAQARAAAFMKRFPTSAHLRRVRAMLDE
jgi:hypothetical protein